MGIAQVLFPSPRWGIGLLLIHLVLSPLVFSRLTADTFELHKVLLLVLTALTLAALLLPEVRRLIAPSAAWLRDPVCWGFLLCLIAAVASTVTSVSPLTSLRGAEDSHAGLLTLTAYTILFAATRRLCPTTAEGRWLMAGPVVASAVAAAYALVQACGADPVGWAGTSAVGGFVRPFGSMGHPNLLAAYLVMALPFVLVFTVAATRRGRRWAAALLALTALIAVAAVVTSLSRAAWLALGLTLGVLSVGWWRLKNKQTTEHTENTEPNEGRGRKRWLFCLGSVFSVCSVVCCVIAPVRERLCGLAEFGGRPHIWEAGVRAFLDSPVFGSGPDTFGVVFSRYRTTAYWHVEWDTTATKAHNEVIHLLATQGLVGFAAGAFLLAAVAYAGLVAWRRATVEDRPLLLAVLAGLAGTAVLGLFGFTTVPAGCLFVTWAAMLSAWAAPDAANPAPSNGLGSPARALVVAGVLAVAVFVHNFYPSDTQNGTPALATVVVALAYAGAAVGVVGTWTSDGTRLRPRRTPAVWPTGPMAVRLLAGVVVLGLALGWGWPWLCASRLCRRATALAEGDPQALSLLDAAVRLDPTWPPYRVALAARAHRAFNRATEPETRQALLVQAHAAMAAAVRLVPARASYHADLGRVLADRVREGHPVAPATALAELEHAQRTDPSNPYLYVDAGKLAAEVGDLARARAHAVAGLALYPNHAPLQVLAGWLELTAGRAVVGRQMLEAAVRANWQADEPARQNLLDFLARLPRPAP